MTAAPLKLDPNCPPPAPGPENLDWAKWYARTYWMRGKEPQTQQALAILIGAHIPMPPAVLCMHEHPAEFAAKWDELMDELGEWRRGERTVTQ